MRSTILLVEDDENDAFFIKRAVRLAEVMNPLQVVPDGLKAIQYLSNTGAYSDRAVHPMPSLVMLDLKLPSVTGLEVLKWIREQPLLASVIVIIFTSSSLLLDIITAYKLGANSYVVKPSDPGKLPGMVKAITHYWLELNQNLPATSRAGPFRSAALEVAPSGNECARMVRACI